MKTIVITGATRGIGLEVLKAIASPDTTIYALVRNKEATQAIYDDLGIHCHIIKCDLTKPDSIKAAVAAIDAPCVDTVVHCAGIFNNQGTMIPFLGSKCEQVWVANSIGPYYLTTCLKRKLDQSNDPSVIFMGSVVGKNRTLKLNTILGNTPKHAYAQSKYAALLLADYFGKKHPSWRVLAAHPGYVNTQIFEGRRQGLTRFMVRHITNLVAQTPTEGARTMIEATFENKKTGTYVVPDGRFELKGDAKDVRMQDYFKSHDTDIFIQFLETHIQWPQPEAELSASSSQCSQ